MFKNAFIAARAVAINKCGEYVLMPGKDPYAHIDKVAVASLALNRAFADGVLFYDKHASSKLCEKIFFLKAVGRPVEKSGIYLFQKISNKWLKEEIHKATNIWFTDPQITKIVKIGYAALDELIEKSGKENYIK